MKNHITIIAIALLATFNAKAQDKINNQKMSKKVKTISLDQTPGEFTQKTVTVAPGTYVFNINNKAVGHDVGFVLVIKGMDINNPKNHIKTAYVTAPVANNTTGTSQATSLAVGEYIYFCPLNPTPTDNLLIVK